MVIRAAVLGHPISHSMSPRIHNSWFRDLAMEGQYEAVDCDPSAFETTAKELAEKGYAGVNVTIPHKAAALALADIPSAAAAEIGAANLLIFRDGKIHADNTDAQGFAETVRRAGGGLNVDRAVVLGAGGAGGAILWALREAGEILLFNRTRARADEVAKRFRNVRPMDWEHRNAAISEAAGLLVNTTSLGMTGQPELDIDLAPPGPDVVVDVIYAPARTRLLESAERLGKKTANGLAMLVYQAAPSFEAFTGAKVPNPEVILRELEAEIS